MTPKEQKVLSQAIQANRRTLAMLDRRIENLIKTNPSLLEEYNVDDRQPFFYGAVGSDNQLGISVSRANIGENPAFGYIRTHPDSAFVLTNITTAATTAPNFLLPEATVTTSTTAGFMNGACGIRMYDESSSRWITFTNHNNEPQQKATFHADTFSPFASFNEGGLALSAECVFPRSAVIRVEVYVQEIGGLAGANISGRIQVVFSGYKVFGG